jgi:hypothetical protein
MTCPNFKNGSKNGLRPLGVRLNCNNCPKSLELVVGCKEFQGLIKVSTPNCDVSHSATPILRPKWDTTCLQFRHKWSKVTNGSWGVLWGSQWELKHVVHEDVQIRIRLVSHLGQPIPWTSTIPHYCEWLWKLWNHFQSLPLKFSKVLVYFLSQHMLSRGHTDESVAFRCGYLRLHMCTALLIFSHDTVFITGHVGKLQWICRAGGHMWQAPL